MRRLAGIARCAWFAVALTGIGLLAAAPVHAQEGEVHRAGLMIVDQEGAVGYAVVPFDEAEISGLELLRRSGADPVTVSFGGLGEGVCGIGKTGCAVDVCRRRMCQTGAADSPYWQSFAPSEGDGWTPLSLGASADRVRDGEVRLWAWTAAEPAVGLTTLSDISARVGARREEVVWEGVAASGQGSSGSVWAGLGVVAAAAAIAGGVTLRSRLRPG